MSALSRTMARLDERRVPCALIGAIAMAAHGAQRATADVDLLAPPEVLDPALWSGLRGLSLEVRRGDDDDSLLGVVRIGPRARLPVDVVVPRGGWVRRALGRTVARAVIDGASIPLLDVPDLVLSKVYAGGFQDVRDAVALVQLPGVDRASCVAHVDAEIAHCPGFVRRTWPGVRATLLG